MSDVSPEEIARHLDRLLASDALSKSTTNRRLLSYLAQRCQQGGDGPKEAEIAIDVFGRDVSFNGGEDSVVRVAMRSLRQKLLEHYSGPGKADPVHFDIPKGAYRLAVHARAEMEAAAPAAPAPEALPARAPRSTGLVLAAAVVLLLVSLAANVLAWRRAAPVDETLAEVRNSLLWRDVATGDLPVMIVLGDLFMYTQTDPMTGRVQTVRDPQINSSDDLRAFLASNPTLAAERGLRYASMIQKSSAVGLAAIIPIVSNPGRRIEVRLRDELMTDDLRGHDIVYIGPIARVGPLAGSADGKSRYRFDARDSSLTDVQTGKVYLPEGELGGHHKDYALLVQFRGAAGNTVTVITAGGRNAGLLQVIRTLTTPAGLTRLDDLLRRTAGGRTPSSFEALISVTGFKQTDLAAEIVDLHVLPAAGGAPRG